MKPHFAIFALAVLALGLIAMGDAHAADEPAPAEASPFVVYDALLFSGKPALEPLGMPELRVLGAILWPGGRPAAQPTFNRIRTLGRWISRHEELVCLDVEHWPVRGDDDVANASIDKLIQISDWLREAAPNLRLGFYAIPPVRDYWIPTTGNPEKIAKWKLENDRLKRLVPHVDVIFPSLYTFYDDPEGWRVYAIANLKEARQYGKPVYAFLWPQYHEDNDELAGQLIDGDFWQMQLEVCREYADGIVIWGGWQTRWDEDAPWWQRTKAFLATLQDQSADAVTSGN